ncbi:unnamed protein product [Peronospora belbahrii]|uniref:Vesicle transport protein USE1 n=1 Tax=Peronospora belbahrii TaxID=622444 RepID=A0AAU9L5M0_9STRA|nr:unnamed protein product [Peronospora belbahrii]CAH0515401.1 unnamed protein product [Peronospora belbahrii]
MATVNCRRFLAAWTRFQTNNEHQMDGDVITHYQQLALHFQQILQDDEESRALQSDVVSVLVAIAALKKEEEECMPKSRRIPRASELVKLREERITVTSQAARTEQKLQLQLGEKMEKKEVHAMPEVRTDLTADDFKSMLKVAAPQEEKLSTKAMRRRLGLVDRSEALTSAPETVVREEQESIQAEMMSLAKQLKDRTQTINHSLAEDVKMLDAVGQSAQSNTALLERENDKLKKQLASSIGLWTSLWLVAMLVVVFIVTYFYMRLFSRRW